MRCYIFATVCLRVRVVYASVNERGADVQSVRISLHNRSHQERSRRFVDCMRATCGHVMMQLLLSIKSCNDMFDRKAWDHRTPLAFLMRSDDEVSATAAEVCAQGSWRTE